jgi:hypothetical protein
MPFSPTGLSALSTAGTFTLWHYVTPDDRATVLAPGYFAPAALQLRAGDVIILTASDATALIPVRSGTEAGTGVTIDSAGTALNLLRSASLPFTITQSASIVARSIAIGSLPSSLVPGTVFAASASVTGPISQLVFSLRDGGNIEIAPAQTVPVVAGAASSNFTAPGLGGGYRIRVSDAADPALFATSPPFAVSSPPSLLGEDGGRLLLESGGLILL